MNKIVPNADKDDIEVKAAQDYFIENCLKIYDRDTFKAAKDDDQRKVKKIKSKIDAKDEVFRSRGNTKVEALRQGSSQFKKNQKKLQECSDQDDEDEKDPYKKRLRLSEVLIIKDYIDNIRN